MGADGNGRVALVTGASRGIGRAAALGLVKAGSDLVFDGVPRQEADLWAVQGEVEERGRRGFVALADVSRKADVAATAREAIAAAGHIDVLINNAGVLISETAEAFEKEHWDAVLDVNAKDTFLITQALLPHMRTAATATSSTSPRSAASAARSCRPTIRHRRRP